MKTHHLHCQNPWFRLIRDGKKIVEGRKNLPKFNSWHIGDYLVFQCSQEQFLTRIVDLRRYKNLREYLNAEGFENVLPGIKSFDEAVDIYLQWSTQEEIAKFGFLAIEVALIREAELT